MHDADSAMEMWKQAKTHREKAAAEKILREHMKVKSRDLTVLLDGTSTYELQARTQFTLSGSEYIWSLLDKEMVQISVARRMLAISRIQASSTGRPLDEVLREAYADSQRDAGPKAESITSKRWELLRETVASILSSELDGLHEIERRAALDEALVEIDVLVRQLKTKIRSRIKRGLPRSWEVSSERAERREFCADMRELGLDPPRSGRLPDMEEVRRTHRRVSADHHPDRRKDPGATEKFHRVNRAYQRILEYVESRKGTE
jgi:DnaJ domain